jgi:hypothetical protein
MLKLTTLSDAQSELMQGGRGHRTGPSRPSRSGNGPIRQTTTNVYVTASQDSDALAFTLGGEYSLAYNDVTQFMNISIVG